MAVGMEGDREVAVLSLLPAFVPTQDTLEGGLGI